MNSRTLAVKVLDRIINEGAYSNIVLSNELNACELSEKDKSLTTEIVYGTLRRKRTIDIIIASFIRDITIMEPMVLNILRIAIYQLKYLDKVPSYAVCNEAVEAGKEVSDKSSKLINGILRNYLKGEEEIKVNAINKIDEIAFEHSFEPWMIRLFISQYGEKKAMEILEGLNETPKVTIRVNDTKSEYDEIFDQLEEDGYTIEEGYICPEAISIKGGRGIDKNSLFVEGKCTVQDESAMTIAPLLGLEDGLTVLDLCSAPGGKTTHIAEILNNTGKVLAFDLHSHKLDLITENATRLGLTNIEVDTMDASILNVDLISSADRVLLDVPCSGLGIIRRKPEIKWNKKRKDLKDVLEVQRSIMKNGWEYLKTGGIMVYSTCTLNKEENEENINWFVETHKDCEVEKIFIGKEDNLVYDALGTLTILPNEYMDGFFVAKLKKK